MDRETASCIRCEYVSSTSAAKRGYSTMESAPLFLPSSTQLNINSEVPRLRNDTAQYCFQILFPYSIPHPPWTPYYLKQKSSYYSSRWRLSHPISTTALPNQRRQVQPDENVSIFFQAPHPMFTIDGQKDAQASRAAEDNFNDSIGTTLSFHIATGLIDKKHSFIPSYPLWKAEFFNKFISRKVVLGHLERLHIRQMESDVRPRAIPSRLHAVINEVEIDMNEDTILIQPARVDHTDNFYTALHFRPLSPRIMPAAWIVFIAINHMKISYF